MSDLNEFLKLVAEGKKNTPSARVKNIEEQVKTNVKSDLQVRQFLLANYQKYKLLYLKQLIQVT